MVVTVRRYLAVLALVLALLAGLMGWTVRMNMLPVAPHHTGMYSHLLADGGSGIYCPPPPRTC